MNKLGAHLKRLGACAGAVGWIATQPSLEQAWLDCNRGDWMAWYIHRVGADGKPWSEKRKPFVLAMCQCARLAQKYVPKGEERPLRCIEMHEAWARDGVTVEQCIEAAEAAGAAWAAEAAGAARAAWAAEAAGAAWVAAEAAWAAEATGAAVAAVAARNKTLSRCADIVREFYPTLPRRRAWTTV